MNWKRSLIGLGIALPLVGLLGFGLTRDPTVIVSPLPGHEAPDFELTVLSDTSTIRLADLRGQVVVLNFWASWCIPCRVEHPELTRAQELYAGRGVRFLGIVYNDSPENARRWLNELGENYPSLVDPGTRTGIDYGVYGVPETFIIDQKGKVVHKQLSVITLDTLRYYIDPLLANGT